MIYVNKIFSPVKMMLQEPRDVQDLCRAIEDSIHKLENKFWGLNKCEVSPNHEEYYNRMKFLLEQLKRIPTQKEFTI